MGERLILVVGGAGYIGTEVTAHLLDKGYRVRCLDQLIYANGHSVVPFMRNPNYEFLHGDLNAPERALEGATDVILLAGLVGDPIVKKFPDEAHRINEVGVWKFITACRKAKLDRFVFISTCSNYGIAEEADEETELNPLSAYAWAKVCAEEMVLRKGFGFKPTVLRFATAFGVSQRMRFDLTVNEFVRTIFLKEQLEVYGADTWRPYCHVSDFARLIRMVLEAPAQKVNGGIFNAGGENMQKRDLVRTIGPLRYGDVAYRTSVKDARDYQVNFDKVREVLGFEPEISVAQGVEEIWNCLELGLFDVGEFTNSEVRYE